MKINQQFLIRCSYNILHLPKKNPTKICGPVLTDLAVYNKNDMRLTSTAVLFAAIKLARDHSQRLQQLLQLRGVAQYQMKMKAY